LDLVEEISQACTGRAIVRPARDLEWEAGYRRKASLLPLVRILEAEE